MPLPPRFEFITTRDDSPTLAYRGDGGVIEHMHHSAGALAESLFIYGGALERALALVDRVHCLSVGLGLGYNEMLTIAALERAGRPGRIHSFEALEFLREEFRGWALGRRDGPLTSTHDQIAARLGVERTTVGRWIEDGRLELRGAFPAAGADLAGCNLVYFDAYSNKMDPHLWDEEVLVEAFGRTLGPTCVLASYAATSVMNRVLRRLSIVKQSRRGFYLKRQSTLGIRLAPDRTA